MEELEHVIAKALLLASPYLVSPYLAAVFGEKLAHALTVNIANRHASRDLRMLMHLDNLVNGLTASDAEFRDVVELVKRADQLHTTSTFFFRRSAGLCKISPLPSWTGKRLGGRRWSCYGF